MNLFLPALTAWRRRGDTKTYDALWSAAGWEACAERLLRERPNCMTAAYTPDAEEKRLREAEARRNRKAERNGKPTVSAIIPWLHAGPELALDLSARRRVEDYLRRAEEALAEDDAVLLVMAEEDRQKPNWASGIKNTDTSRPFARRETAWPRARRGAWA